MAEIGMQNAQTDSSKSTDAVEQALSEAEKKFNRRVNYFIMRFMWQVIRGRRRNELDTIYAVFETSRERYTRVIDTGAIRYGKDELIGLQEKTGLRREIFTGEARFECPYMVKAKSGQTVEQTITTEEWQQLFKWRADRKKQKRKSAEKQDEEGEHTEAKTEEQNVQVKEKEKTYQDRIYDKLRRVRRTNMGNRDFYRLCYYLQNLQAAPIRTSPGKVRDIEMAINEITVSLLDGCEMRQLENLRRLLKTKGELVNSVIIYKEAKKMESKKSE